MNTNIAITSLLQSAENEIFEGLLSNALNFGSRFESV